MARKYQSGTQTGHTILVIDDSPDIVASSRQLLEAEGHRVVTASDGPEGLELAAREHPHLILVDYFMPEMTGEEVVRRIRERDHLVQIILATGYAGEKPAREMMKHLDIQGYHDKGEGAERLLLWVDSALKAYRSAVAAEKHRVGLQYILDITPDMHRLQPLDELLQGLLWQIEGLMGAENSFLATYSSEKMQQAASAEIVEGFVALREGEANLSQLAIRVGTGRFRPGISTDALPEPERTLLREAVERGGVSFSGGVSVLPLRLGDQTLGAIFIDRHPGFERDRDLLDIFAAQAAVAIQSALLYGENELLYDLATKDPTSGVFLRGYAMQQLQQHLKRAHRTGAPLSVLMIDLDRFKELNDTHGHLAGDQGLRAVGDLLRATVRETDCVGRYGGDEFLVILPDTPAPGAAVVAQRILDRLPALSVEAEAGTVHVQLSVGIGCLLGVGEAHYERLSNDALDQTINALIGRADQALYAAKGTRSLTEPGTVAWAEILPAEAAA